MIFAKQLKIGDKVNGHENGWMTVKHIENGWQIIVKYDSMFGEIEKHYFPNDKIERVEV